MAESVNVTESVNLAGDVNAGGEAPAAEAWALPPDAEFHRRCAEPGALELCFAFEPVSGGRAVASYSTPSMWAIADMWADSLQASSWDPMRRTFGHTDAWTRVKMLDAIALQVAQDAGLLRPSPISLEAIAEMNNAFSVHPVGDLEAAEAVGPDPLAPGAGA